MSATISRELRLIARQIGSGCGTRWISRLQLWDRGRWQKGRLTEWLAAGKLPWSCMSWEGLDAAAIARLRQELREAGIMSVAPSAPYYNGDPKFWGTSLVEIDWADNAAYETVFVIDGARARGIKVPARAPPCAIQRASRAQAVARRWRLDRRRSRPHEGGQRDPPGHPNHRFCA